MGPQLLTAYEKVAGPWIAAFRAIGPQVGHAAPLLRRSLGITRHQSFEDAMEAGERFAIEFKLGEVPATRLIEVMEGDLGILVLMVDAFQGISGAACRLPELDVVLINRKEVPGRRHFDLGHELFHILTWDAMPPEHSEESKENGGNRVEQLANNFASAVLMPVPVLNRFGDWSDLSDRKLTDRLNSVADELQVAASALKWRLVALDRLKPAVARTVSDSALRYNGRRTPAAGTPPLLFSKPFMEVIAGAVNEGRVSARRTASLLDLSLDDLAGLFAAHGVKPPFDL